MNSKSKDSLGGKLDLGMGADYKSVKRTIEANDCFEKKMMEIVEENKALKAQNKDLSENLEFYLQLESRIGGGQSLAEFLDVTMTTNRQFDQKLLSTNEKFLKLNKKYNLLQAKHESIEKKYLESEKQQKVLAEKNHSSKIETRHTTLATQDKDKTIRSLNEKMSMLHNEISRLKIENNNIRRDCTPKARHNSTINSIQNNNPISHMTNNSRSRPKLSGTNKNYPLGTNKFSGLIPQTPTHVQNSVSSLSINKENRNSLNTPNYSQEKNSNFKQNHFYKNSIPKNSEKNSSIFDNKALSSLQTIEENNAMSMTAIYHNNPSPGPNPNESTDNALDTYKSKCSRSPIMNKNSKRTLQKTPKAKNSKFSSNHTRNSSKVLVEKESIDHYDKPVSPSDTGNGVGG